VHLNLKQFVQETSKQNDGLLVAFLPINADEWLCRPPLSNSARVQKPTSHIRISSYLEYGVSFKIKICKCMLANHQRILTWLEGDFTCILYISVSVFFLLLGWKCRACFMAPTGYEFSPKPWCWYLILAQILQLQTPGCGDEARSKMRCGWWPMTWQPRAVACQLKDHLHNRPDNPPGPPLP